MFGYHYLILNLFTWLAFLSPSNELEMVAIPPSSFEEVVTTDHKQSPAVIELGSYLNEIIDSSQNIELPLANYFNKIYGTFKVSYRSKLLYFQIGNAIELELTSTSIIFPFHCFT